MKVADKELLLKFLENKCTLEENVRVQELLKQPGVQAVLEEMTRAAWDNPGLSDEELRPVLIASKEKFFARVKASRNQFMKISHPINSWRFLQHAAVWVGVLVVAGALVWLGTTTSVQRNIQYVQQMNSHEQPEMFILPDSSKVFLGVASRICYPSGFKGDTREVELTGEAFFDVKRNPEKPFIVRANNVETKVLGTSFKIESFQDQPLIVSVATGRVEVSRYSNNEKKQIALLTPGRSVSWNEATSEVKRDEVDVESFAQWTNGNLVFNHKTMQEIAGELKRRFGVNIDFVDQKIAREEITGVFPKGKPVSEIMQTLSVVGGFSYEITGLNMYKVYTEE